MRKNNHQGVGMDLQKTSARRILLGSLVGTTIEFFDFYIYANAAVLVFPALFFPSENPTSAMLQSFATFSVAFSDGFSVLKK